MDAHATVAAIVALQMRANKLFQSANCALPAAAEKVQEAVVLAQRLPGLPEDNLVALHLQLERCKFLLSQATRTDRLCGADNDTCRLFVSAASSAMLPVVAALSRHMDAGTLQPGRCAPLEEAWFIAFVVNHEPEEVRAAATVQYAAYGLLVGLTAVYVAAHTILMMVLHEKIFGSTVAEMLPLVVRALDTVYKPRPSESEALVQETMLVRSMLKFQTCGTFEHVAVTYPACSSGIQQIREAWARVQASGVLERRGLIGACADLTRTMQAREGILDVQDERQARRGLRSCGLASCGAKEAHVDHFKRCSACKTVVYCCREHQLEHWPAHKAACKAARKAAANDKQ